MSIFKWLDNWWTVGDLSSSRKYDQSTVEVTSGLATSIMHGGGKSSLGTFR